MLKKNPPDLGGFFYSTKLNLFRESNTVTNIKNQLVASHVGKSICFVIQAIREDYIFSTTIDDGKINKMSVGSIANATTYH